MLGSLVEKETTTPDTYPLSTNGLVLACNQRSSRDPVVEYDERTVTTTMLSLRERGFARTLRGDGSRVYKHEHALDEALGVGRSELAVLSVLMLRGPQTVGELRTRTERQHAFASLEEVDDTLDRLAGRDEPLVRPLARQPGQKEARWIHLLGVSEVAPQEAPAPQAPASESGDDEALASQLSALREDIAALRAEVAELRARMG